MKKLWTDGSAEPNPGRGGFAVIEEIGRNLGKPVVLGSEEESTNIRMEGKAIIAAMKYAGGEECIIHTDSNFWIQVLTEWAEGWSSRGWRTRKGPVANLELVKEAYALYRGGKTVELKWVAGHRGIALNEMADEWAGRAREGEKITEV
ncbi:MAG: ribonuclease H [Candidatus Saccharibacteria bacterium]|nr:ribonuclease H [Candidatus Saccharibacteria bacterium]